VGRWAGTGRIASIGAVDIESWCLVDTEMSRKVSTPQATSAPAKAPGSHSVRRDEAERRLLNAAARIVADRGIDGLTLADVGETAGYSRGAPRHFFGKKNDLVGALARFIADSFAQNLAKASTREPGMASLLFAVESYFDGAATSPMQGSRALQAVIIESLREPALLPAMSAVTDRGVARIAANIRRGIKLGNIRSDIDVHSHAQIILATLRMATMQWMIDPDHIDLAATRDAFVANLRRALAPQQ
jgi:AcrR family transcriptional regulator